jgi:hypothetical protein
MLEFIYLDKNSFIFERYLKKNNNNNDLHIYIDTTGRMCICPVYLLLQILINIYTS